MLWLTVLTPVGALGLLVLRARAGAHRRDAAFIRAQRPTRRHRTEVGDIRIRPGSHVGRGSS